ncbi:MAG: HAD family phosphatase [Planctomycetaceae bacterium]
MLKTILFDMGNVLVKFSHQRMCQQLASVCQLEESTVRSRLFDSNVQADFERGLIDEQEYCQYLTGRKIHPAGLSLLRTAGSDIFSLIEPMPAILDSLKEHGLRLVLLSNTSVWHYDWIRQMSDVLERFDDVVASWQVGAMKPEPKIFQAALEKIGCLPEECFYTDDIPEYVATGRTFGLQAEVFTGPEQLREHLAQRGVRLTE